MRLHVIVVFLACVFGQEAPPPLPTPDGTIVEHYKLALEAVFGVGIRLQAFLQEEQNENFLVSPISATVVLGQLILGAEGEFRKQLVELLALPNSHLYENDTYYYHQQKIKTKNNTFALPYSTLHIQLASLLRALQKMPEDHKNFVLKQKSALFIDQKIQLNKTFRKSLKDFYETRIKVFDFQNKANESFR